MRIPVQKIVRCHKCGYTAYSREPFFRRNLNKRPYYCGYCGSKDLIEVLSENFHIVICLKAEDIPYAVKVLGNIEDIPNVFVDAFQKEDNNKN